MPLAALALVLAAAVGHAAWNLYAKRARGGIAFVWLGGVGAVTLYAIPAAAQLALGSRSLATPMLAFAAGSGVLHATYFAALQRGYREGDLSVVYPLARGTGPALAVLAAVVVLGERPGAVALAGAALIVAAVLSMAAPVGRGRSRAAIGFALATGATIAVYTLWDAHAVQELEAPAITYFWLASVTQALLLACPALRDRAALRDALDHDRRAIVAVALLSPLSYILVLVAFTLAPVSLVAPGREASIVIAALLGAHVLGEGERRRRMLAAVAIVAGIALLAAG